MNPKEKLSTKLQPFAVLSQTGEKVRKKQNKIKLKIKRREEVVDLCSDTDSDETHVTFASKITKKHDSNNQFTKKHDAQFRQKVPSKSQSQHDNINSQVSEANSECLFDLGSKG